VNINEKLRHVKGFLFFYPKHCYTVYNGAENPDVYGVDVPVLREMYIRYVTIHGGGIFCYETA